MHELDGLGVREPLEQQECQQRFCESWLVAGWESGLAALFLFLSGCCVGTLCCPPKPCKTEILYGRTRLLVPLYPCPVGLGGVSII